jgi:hypothetical protein
MLIASTFLPIEGAKVSIETTFVLIERLKVPIAKVSR